MYNFDSSDFETQTKRRSQFDSAFKYQEIKKRSLFRSGCEHQASRSHLQEIPDQLHLDE